MTMKTKPEKYTREFVLSELKNMSLEISRDAGIYFIGQLFDNRDYSRQRFSEWATKFKNDDEISDIIKRIEGILESRLVTGGLKSELNPTITIFTLKNKHGWHDKTEQEITNPDGSLSPTVKIIDERK